jgi:hypothetical protein
MRKLIVCSIALLLMILGWGSSSWGEPFLATTDIKLTVFKLIGMIVLYLFLPLNAITYFFFCQHQRTFEVERILDKLHLEAKEDRVHRKAYGDEKSGYYFFWSVTYASVVSGIGLALLFLGSEMFHFGELAGEFPSLRLGAHIEFPEQGSRLICGMAFLGAYLWGLQYVFRRYVVNDLRPSVYYSLSIRMILAALVALVLYNAYEVLAGFDPAMQELLSKKTDVSSEAGSSLSPLWPVLAFLIGMFPQRGLRWLTERLPILSSGTSPTVREAPLEMVEGIETHDKMRLEELGIDTCYDLAVTDFVPLILNTPYSARQLVDWILQAKLCAYFGDAVKDLRQRGIRTIVDLEHLTQKDVEALVRETAATESALQRAQRSVQEDAEIKRLRRIGQLLGRFVKDEEDLAPPLS